MNIRYTDSASKHGLTEEEIVWVILHAVRTEEVADRHGRPAKKFVGSVHAQTNRLAEVFVSQDGADFVVFHAMEIGERLQ